MKFSCVLPEFTCRTGMNSRTALMDIKNFQNYAYANDAKAVPAQDRSFTVDVDQILNCVTDRTRLVTIANPDNPTGTYISASEVRRLHTALPGHVLLVLDSAYLEYVDAQDFENPMNLVECSENVVMTRTFSKIYGLAGIRLGWAYAPVAVADVLRRASITFPVSNPALSCGIAALKDMKHTASVHAKTLQTKRWFTASLKERDLHVYPSQTNFLLVSFPDPSRSAQKVYDYLMANGIITRRFASTAFSDCIRFTIGLDDEMSSTVEALDRFFAKN